MDSVVRKFRITTPHGDIAGKTHEVEVNGYNLDVIISVGYRLKSISGRQNGQKLNCPEIPDSSTGRSPLHLAMEKNFQETAEVLIKHGGLE